jgi:hypothetical protein
VGGIVQVIRKIPTKIPIFSVQCSCALYRIGEIEICMYFSDALDNLKILNNVILHGTIFRQLFLEHQLTYSQTIDLVRCQILVQLRPRNFALFYCQFEKTYVA